MDGRLGIPQVNNFQISTSWVPTTPAKPDLPPIYENRQQNQQNLLELQRVSHRQGPSQEHQLGLRSFMQEEPEAQQVAALFGLTNSTPATPDSVPNSGNIQNQRNWLELQRMSHGQGPSQGNKLGLRSFVQEEPEAQYVAARCGLTYSAPVKPGSLSKCGNMQQNQRNWLELQRMSHGQGPSQGNQLGLRSFMQGELEARQVAACCKSTYSAPAKPGPPSICGNRQQNQQNWLELQRTAHGPGPSQVNQLGLTSFLQEEPEAQHVAAHCGSTNSLTVMEHFDTWEAAVGTNSKTSGDSNKMHNNFSTDDADKWNASFGDLLALAHAAGSTAAAENENTETAFTNSSFNSLVTSQDADGSTICSRLSFNLNSPARMADEGLSSNDALQFEPITPDHIKNKGHVRQKESSEGTLKGTEANSNPQPKEQSGQVLNISELQEDHKLDKQKQRRKKHRPKVVVEGQPKRTPKPRTPKQHNSEESKRVKRTYVRRRQVDKPTPNLAEEGTSIVDEPAPNLAEEGVIDPLKVSRPRRTCRRSLNFDLESLLCDENLTYWPFLTVEESYANQSHSSVQLGKGSGATTVNTKLCTAYDMTHPEIQYPDTSTPKIGLNHDKVTMSSQNEISRKCKIIFSDETHDKQAGVLEMTPKRSNNSNCSSACLTQETAERALKRRHSLTTDEAEVYRNIRGSYYNSIQAYQAILPAREPYTSGTQGMHFPAIYKKKRTEKGHPSATQYAKPFTCETNYLSLFHCNGGLSQAKSRMQNANPESAFTAVERYRRKRSKSTSRVRDIASLLEICKHFPTPPVEFGDRCENLYHPNTCMEALVASSRAMMKTKKRSKRSILTTSHMHARQPFTTNARGSLPAIAWRGISPVDEIAERLQNLDLNRGSVQDQNQYAEIRLRNKVKVENALVIYQRDGSIVPFAGSFVRKRQLRPKVELDDETTRVWKLLLQNINSEGIDGTDEDKTRWWEEERGVFHGRVDSFVARMRLVQGDRRFSPWKGSVVDSVVGVFLTQNVSDHLSSSAFMSLATRFPLKSKTGNKRHEERTGIIIEEPEESALDPDDTIGWRDDQATLGQDLLRISSEESNVEKRDVHSSESSENSTEISVSQQLGSSRESSCVCHESIPVTVNGATSFSGDQAEPEDLLSSQNSMDFPVVQTSERTESFSGSTSFLRLLKIAGSSELHGILDRKSVNIDVACCLDFQNNEEKSHKGSVGNLCPCSYSGSSLTEAQGSKCIDDEAAKFSDLSREPGAPEQRNLSPESANQVPTEAPKFSETALDVREEVSVVSDSCKSEYTALRSMNNGKDQGGNTLDRANDNPKSRKQWPGKEKQNVNWDNLRLEAQGNGKKREKTANTMDSLDWDAVRCADVNEIAHTIRERGMNNMLAERIKDFLNRIFREHGSIDLEWLRDVPPDKAKEYLLSIRGLGLKSVECVRLLTLHHLAFPVDTNVGRIAVRLGWVPLQPLPESLQLHLLELYPVLESIQKYLWPRLCKLDQRTLYELHYHMITFGKVFCTKSKPNCNACPMRAECRHFASAFASARLALPAPEEKSIVSATENKAAGQNQFPYFSQLPLPLPQTNKTPVEHPKLINSAPIIEVPATPEPIVEEPATPEPEQKTLEIDIEDAYSEETNEIPIIDLNMEEFTENVKKFVGKNMELQQVEMSKALVALTPEAASIPTPKLKHISRLRTEHQVYELPDSHPLLEGFDKREQDDPCSYLLAIWTPGETADSIQPPGRQCNSQETGTLCDDETCSACNSIRETRSQTVRGTLLIPCRTAMRGSFPLNGTYFQVNEVFADHDSSLNPIDVPRGWLWNLPRRTVYFGTSVPTIFKGQTTESIQHCFWRGFVCVRGFDKRTRAPRPLIARLHFPASKLTRAKGKQDEN